MSFYQMNKCDACIVAFCVPFINHNMWVETLSEDDHIDKDMRDSNRLFMCKFCPECGHEIKRN
jgi:hypothetical protein